MSSYRQNNNDLLGNQQRLPSKNQTFKLSGISSRKNQSVLSPQANTQKRYKNIQMLQSKIKELKNEPMEDKSQQQQFLQNNENLHSIQKTQIPNHLKLGDEEFILENNYLKGTARTGKYSVRSPLEMQDEDHAYHIKNQDARQSPLNTDQQLRDKLVFFSKRLQSVEDLAPERVVQTEQTARTKTLNTNIQSHREKFDLNQYSSGNLQKLIRDSRGQNNGKKYFMNERNPNNPTNYNLNGRKSKQKIRPFVQIQNTGEIIENHYQKLNQSYNQIFKNQDDLRKNNLKNKQILNNHRQIGQEMNLSSRRNKLSSSLPGIRSHRKNQQSTLNLNTQRQCNNQQHANGQNNNNFQNNINNSIIVLQAPPSGFLSPQPVSNDDFKFIKHQLKINNPQYNNDSRGRIDPMRNQQRNNISPFYEKFHTQDDVRTKKSISPSDIQNNRADKLTNQSQVDLPRSHANFSGGTSNHLRSISADHFSSNDPESIERQNNQMLMQILYNNLKRTNLGRSKSKKKQKLKNAVIQSQDNNSNHLLMNETKSQSSKGFPIKSGRNQTTLERKYVVPKSPSYKEGSEIGGSAYRSHRGGKNITNFSSYVHYKVLQTEKSKSPKDTKQSGIDINVSQHYEEMQALSQVTDSLRNTTLKHAIKQAKEEEKKRSISTEAQQLQEASQKIELLLKENQIFNDVDCEQITNTMILLLAEEKNNIKYLRQPNTTRNTNQTQRSRSNQSGLKSLISVSRNSIMKKGNSFKKPKETAPKQQVNEAKQLKKIDTVQKKSISLKVSMEPIKINVQNQDTYLNVMIPKNFSDKRKSVSSALGQQNIQKKSSSGNQSETNTMLTAQFPHTESQTKLIRISSGQNKSPLGNIIGESSKSDFNLNLENIQNTVQNTIEAKIIPPELNINIQEERGNQNLNSSDIPDKVSENDKVEILEKEIEQVQIQIPEKSPIAKEALPVVMEAFQEEAVETTLVMADEPLEIVDTPLIIEETTPVSEETPSVVIETPSPNAKNRNKVNETPPPVAQKTQLQVITEQSENNKSVSKLEQSSMEKNPRKTPSPAKLNSKSRSPKPTKIDKFSQFLIDQIDAAEVDNKPLQKQEKTSVLDLPHSDLKQPFIKLQLGNLPVPSFVEVPKQQNDQTFKIPLIVTEINQEPINYIKMIDFNQNEIKKSQNNYLSNKNDVCAPNLDEYWGYSKIQEENIMFDEFKIQIEEKYSQAKQKYQSLMKKITYEKKLKMLGKQKENEVDQEAIEIEIVNQVLINECQRINSALTLFKIDLESYLQRFQDDIKIDNSIVESQDQAVIENSRLGVDKKNNSNNLQKKESFREKNYNIQKKESFREKSKTTFINVSPSQNLNNNESQDALVGLSGRSNSINKNSAKRVKSYSPYSSDAEIERQSDAKSNFQYINSDSMRSQQSYNGLAKKSIMTQILTQQQMKICEDEVSLQLQLKKFLTMGDQDPDSTKFKCLIRQMTSGMTLQTIFRFCKSHKYSQFMHDKLNIKELYVRYFEEQFKIQYPFQDPYKKIEYVNSISNSISDGDSELLGSTISSFSQFSAYSVESGEEIYPLLELNKIKRNFSFQDMFPESEKPIDGQSFQSIKAGEDLNIRVENSHSSISDSQDTINFKQVFSQGTIVYQDSSQDNSDHHEQPNMEEAPNILQLKIEESGSRNNKSCEFRDQQIQPKHIDRPNLLYEQSLAIVNYEKVNEFELNQTLDHVNIKNVNFFLNKINDIWMKKAQKNIDSLKKNHPVTQTDLTKIHIKFRKLVRKLQKQKYWETLNNKVFEKFKLTHLIDDMIFATQDYEEWLSKRLKGYDSASIKRKSQQLDEWNNENFWGGDQKLLKKFLQKDQINLQQDQCSISSDLDGEDYNNTDCIQMMHEGLNPNLLLKNVIKDKNMQYEIFKIMSQTKLQKIKNQIVKVEPYSIQDRIILIDQRFRWIQKLARIKYMKARGLSNPTLELNDLPHNSEHSSEFSSDDSVEQTAKYFFIEELELQANLRRLDIDFKLKKQDCSTDKVKHKIRTNKQYQFGYRYGNVKKSKSVIIKSGEKIRPKSPVLQIKLFEKPKEVQEVGHVRLLNGCAMQLDEQDNIINKYGNSLSILQKSKAEIDISRIQGYYDFVKDHILNKSKQDKIIIKYKRKQMLKEHQIDQDIQIAFKEFLTHKIRIVHGKQNKKAISYNITSSSIKRYTNPFEMSRFIKSDNIKSIMSNMMKQPELKKEKQIHIKSKKFYTADSNQANGVEEFIKPIDYKQGIKCENFVFKCKLQSIGDFADMKRFENEVKQFNQYPKDVLQYKNIIEPDSGYPIYMLFEVLHVNRKAIQDAQQDQQKALQIIKDLTNDQEAQKLENIIEQIKQKQSPVNNVELF